MTLFVFGFGYAASFIAGSVPCVGTKRIEKDTPPVFAFDGKTRMSAAAEAALDAAEAVLVSVPPDENGDSVFRVYGTILAQKKNLKWLGYFSSTAVYGDASGDWVDETMPPAPVSEAGRLRLMAEGQWRSLDLPLHIFRLSGLYGPGRSALDRARAGAPIIEKPGHVTNRIHVADVAQIVTASIQNPTPNEIFNISDDEPASSAEVLRAAYESLGKTPPAVTAAREGQRFFEANRRVRNTKIKEMLGISLKYPSWRAGEGENKT